ncbi:hypothetical protein VTI28DRAFT_8570 [Corynascus sepedonium]
MAQNVSAASRKRQLCQSRKRRKTLIKKVDEYHRLCGAQVYLVIWTNCRFYVYSSNSSPEWPPSSKDILNTFPLPTILNPDSIEKD